MLFSYYEFLIAFLQQVQKKISIKTSKQALIRLTFIDQQCKEILSISMNNLVLHFYTESIFNIIDLLTKGIYNRLPLVICLILDIDMAL